MDAVLQDRWPQAGASVLSAATLQEGWPLADHPQLSAAILDFGLGDGDTGVLCARLTERGIPFVIYTGYDKVHDACRAGILVQKPALLDTLVKTIAKLLEQK